MMDVELYRECSLRVHWLKPISRWIKEALRWEAKLSFLVTTFAGLDVDKKSISVTFTDHQGSLKSMRMPYSVEHLVNHVRKHYGDKKVAFAYEAGPTGYGLYDGLSLNSTLV